jgi:hypothetical protein
MHASVCAFVCLRTPMFVCMCVHASVYLCTPMYMCMPVYAYICVYVYVRTPLQVSAPAWVYVGYLGERHAAGEQLEEVAALEENVWVVRLARRLDRHAAFDQVQLARQPLPPTNPGQQAQPSTRAQPTRRYLSLGLGSVPTTVRVCTCVRVPGGAGAYVLVEGPRHVRPHLAQVLFAVLGKERGKTRLF